MTIELRKDEEKLIMLVRSCKRFSTIKVEKRPTPYFPDGELLRVTVEESFKLEEIIPDSCISDKSVV